MFTVFVILAISAFVLTLIAAIGRVPLWIAVIVLCLIALLQNVPLGK